MDEYSSHRHTPSLSVDEAASTCCYDADTSSNSTDYNSSVHEEVSQAALHRGFGEAAARGAKNSTGFYPVNEDTVFMEHPSSHGLISGSGRVVGPGPDWMLYSNSNSSSSSDSSEPGSSDEYCCGEHTLVNSEDTSSDLDIGILPRATECPLKRNRHMHHRHRLRLYEEEPAVEDDDEEDEDEDDDDCASVSKRFKTKACISTASSTQQNLGADEPQVDVRMIDFAHTTFGHNTAATVSNSNSTIHQGPDYGFLTGLDSLKRLFLEILADG